MPSSDSEDFESADEGISSCNKKERKKHLSSSSYSDKVSDSENKKQDEKGLLASESTKDKDNPKEDLSANSNIAQESSGWDDFDDWGDTNVIETNTEKIQRDSTIEKETCKTAPKDISESLNAKTQETSNTSTKEHDIQSVADKLAATSTKSEGWGWGWGMDSLLSTATAGITTLTNQVSQGISTVLETGIGAPDPEELARKSVKENVNKSNKTDKEVDNVEQRPSGDNAENAFQFGNLLSGVTKFVETTGTKVLSGGLDTLETIGKKTMEVLQDGDPGLAKKRAMLGLDSGDKPVLSQLLREAKAKADEEDKVKEAKREAKEVHYETLFDDFEGLVHLEALEMLSKQTNMRIQDLLRTASPDKKQDIRETLQQVAELCEMPEEEEDEEDEESETKPSATMDDDFHDRLQKATKDIGCKIQFQPLVKQYTNTLEWLNTPNEDLTEKVIYKRAVSGLAETTALAVEIYHKTAEMLLVKTRRSTADEADALTQLTVVLTKHISDLASQFTEKLYGFPAEDKDQINNYITNVFLEAGNSSKYVENAFHLTLPIIQIGAV